MMKPVVLVSQQRAKLRNNSVKVIWDRASKKLAIRLHNLSRTPYNRHFQYNFLESQTLEALRSEL